MTPIKNEFSSNNHSDRFLLSIVVPIAVASPKHYLIKRLDDLLSQLYGNTWFEVVVVDSSQFISSNSKIEHICNKYTFRYSKISYQRQFSIGSSRNHGASISNSHYLLFLDVDLTFGENFLFELYKNVLDLKNSKEPAKFIIIPCFYLSQIGTNIWSNSKYKPAVHFRLSFLKGSSKYIENIAAVSSALVVNTKHYLSLDGHNSKFVGHGCEDFEFIHRLASSYPHSLKPNDYYLDYKTRLVGNYKGFRAYFLKYSFQYVFTELHLFHRWHPRKVDTETTKHRTKNEKLLQNAMKEFDTSHDFKSAFENSTASKLLSVNEIISNPNLTSGLPINGLFNNLSDINDGYLKRYIAFKKARKMFFNPKKFIFDSFLFRSCNLSLHTLKTVRQIIMNNNTIRKLINLSLRHSSN